MSASSSFAREVATSLRAGASLGLGRLGRRRLALYLVAAVVLAALAAVLMRRAGVSGSLERSLGASFRWLVPLSAYAASIATIGRRSLREGLWGAARFGHSRAWLGLGRASVSVGLSAAMGCLAGLAAVLGVLPHPGVGLLGELLTVAWIGALVGAAYALWFALGASFGRRAQGRTVVLVLDFVVGEWGPFGVVFPRGLGLDLLALASPLEVPQRAASAILVLSIAVLSGAVAWRSSDLRRG